jgi:hypothetical protein
MPDTLTPEDWADLRHMATTEPQVAALLAHIDALTAEHDACVEKVGHALTCSRSEVRDAAAEEPYDA